MLRTALRGAAMVAAVLVVGTTGYMLIERLDLLTALYMTVITVSTVGFKEVSELTPAGMVFTIGLIVVGVVTIGYTFGTFVEFLVEGRFSGLIEERRMQRTINGLSGHHIVAGMGRVGTEVARALSDNKADFVVIDNCPDCVERAREQGWLIVEGDATEDGVLAEAGVERAHSLLAALDTDADNVFVTLAARTANPDLFIVARATSDSAQDKLRKAGADRAITPTAIGGRRMAGMALHPLVSDYVDVVSRSEQLELRLEEVVVAQGSELAGKTIRQLEVHDRTGAFIVAVNQATGQLVTNPHADMIIEAGDKLVAFGTEYQLEALAKMAEQM